jgi:hypothetical protein
MSDETFHAVVKGVHVEVLGDTIASAASIGATTLTVRDVADFDEDGGYLRLNDVVLEYLSCDDDTSTITLAVALVAAAAVDDKVDAWDKANGQPAKLHKARSTRSTGSTGSPPWSSASPSPMRCHKTCGTAPANRSPSSARAPNSGSWKCTAGRSPWRRCSTSKAG